MWQQVAFFGARDGSAESGRWLLTHAPSLPGRLVLADRQAGYRSVARLRGGDEGPLVRQGRATEV